MRTATTTDETIRIRDGEDRDGDALIALIGGVFTEYPGCVLDVDAEMPELRAIATSFRRWRGRFWVAEREGVVVGCVGCTPSNHEGGLELRKLYVAAHARNRGLGSLLCDLVEQRAREERRAFVDLWSDTRFVTAHRLYERRGYLRGPATRELHDLSATVEYYYRLDLASGLVGA